MAEDRVAALRSSVDRLHRLATALDEAALTGPAYPTEWTVADVLSHLGSGAVITRRRLEDALAGRDTPEDFAPGVWDEWNAKAPSAQRDDLLGADAALLDRIEAVTADERAAFTTSMGPMTLDFAGFVGLRLNEHVFHTWDVEVVGDPDAVLPPEVAGAVVDNLDMIAGFTARPTGDTAHVVVATTAPDRRFAIDLTPESVSFSSDPGAATDGPAAPASAASAASADGPDASAVDLELPAEALARLVYGRLDPDHTPAGVDGPPLATLRQVFPGF